MSPDAVSLALWFMHTHS